MQMANKLMKACSVLLDIEAIKPTVQRETSLTAPGEHYSKDIRSEGRQILDMHTVLVVQWYSHHWEELGNLDFDRMS